MNLDAAYVSIDDFDGLVFQVSFYAEDPDADVPYLLIQRQFEDEDGDVCYIETDDICIASARWSGSCASSSARSCESTSMRPPALREKRGSGRERTSG